MKVVRVDEEKLVDMVSLRAAKLLAFCEYNRVKRQDVEINILVISFISGEAMMLEELLDTYGARNNQDWYLLRSLIGSMKAYSKTCFELLHLQRTNRRYVDFPHQKEFLEATNDALVHCSNVIYDLGCTFVEQAGALGLSLPHYSQFFANYYKCSMPEGFLSRGRKSGCETTALQRIVHLSTSFLNLVAQGAMFNKIARKEDVSEIFPNVLNEEILMKNQYNFHSLQTLYDTYVSDSLSEQADGDLKKLRGHISVIYHLFEILTSLAHFYERHQGNYIDARNEFSRNQEEHEVADESIHNLIRYSIKYINKYMASGRGICREMLRRYTEISSVQVPVPSFRGFHVRPSSLVAKIVQHYGSEVEMVLDGATYDAGNPLDLFRANERINALKRHALGKEVAQKQSYDKLAVAECDMKKYLREFILELATKNIVFIYQRPLQINDIVCEDNVQFSDVILRESIKLMGAGKIDVGIDMKAEFKGDIRVLDDLKILAENGYCEDAFGNNIPIPISLPYLQRS